MKAEAVKRAERLLGIATTSWMRVETRGYATNEHWTVELADGSRAFLKHAAPVDPCPRWLRDEHAVYSAVSGPFMPRLLGWEDDPERPLLVVEDLSDARWVPPWEDGDVAAVLATLAELAATTPHGPLPRFEDYGIPSWETVAEDPAPFLSTGLADAGWLEHALATLVAATEQTPRAGDSVIHCDVRSDNLCVREGRVILFDWNHAAIGNPALDIAAWLPSLALEGGPAPSDVGGADDFAAFVAGFFASRAGLPPPEGAPTVRLFQREQAEVAIPWACRVLDLPPPA
ncbi:MAG TPA: phosphotransferase [Gaiellaceae bacterium]|nr:phosphotransferase [Gaiellaceae bacterium]